MFYVNYFVSGTSRLHWQVSKDNGSSWADIDASDSGTASTGDTETCVSSEWGSSPWTWTDGVLHDTISNVVLGNDIIIKVDENTNVDWETGYPKIDNSTFGGIRTLGLSLDPKSGSGESAVKTTITFPNAVNDLRLFLTDIDSKTGNWKDKVVISSDAGNPTIESVNTNPTFTVSGNTITSKENSESFADNRGTAKLTFPDGVKTITITYTDVSGLEDPEIRGIGISFDNICINTGSVSYTHLTLPKTPYV